MDIKNNLTQRVLVVGAGPIGLAVASALASQGIAVDIIDKRAAASPHSRAFGLEPVTLELLNAWGIADEMIRQGIVWSSAPVGDKKGRTLSFSTLALEFPYMVIIPQSYTEAILTAWAEKMGIDIQRNCKLKTLQPTGQKIEVKIQEKKSDKLISKTYDWVLGADGVNSAVRQQMDIPFTGRDYKHSLVVADVILHNPPSPTVHARSVSRGLVALFPLPDGTFRISLEDNKRMTIPVEQPVTPEEIRNGMQAILGNDFGLGKILWGARYRSKQRLADQYRKGNIFLLGDAAHTHVPAGGQGLQMGLGDAANLGWKLAGVIKGQLLPEILDSYENERRPIAAAALKNTDLLFKFNTASGFLGRMIHWLGTQTTKIPYVEKKVVSLLAGESAYYHCLRRKGDHKLVGGRLPYIIVCLKAQSQERLSLTELLRQGKFVLIHRGAEKLAVELRHHYHEIVVATLDAPKNILNDGQAVIVRPDGIVLWVGHDLQQANERLRFWI
ncbi:MULTISPECIES: FAD-dependent monooxygenase [Photorhabdus]|uniref:FAD-dependent monooxygenase n=1 Tax=Photorhabdus TaxID=29487 RepID=UPI000D4AD958|nr:MULTISPECIES: FAD-dependent monooxygenase [Photorhabdus]MBS9427707.1 monooxygenase [Photorhabdus akhurstii]MCC8457907.1 FAD-dependent monooxygenase [Photorhabdus aegyptia]PQQ40232.1 monooxygenase [Photorhabdus luminescens]